MSTHLKYAQKRLLRDWAEIRSLSPEEGIFAQPLDDNILEWHANIVPTSGRYQGMVIHCLLFFPDSYPRDPPMVKLGSFVPHTNIIDHNGIPNQVCHPILTMYDQTQSENRGWLPSFTVRTIILHLHSLFLEECIVNRSGEIKDTLYQVGYGYFNLLSTRFSYAKAFGDAYKYECPHCSHSITTPFPKIPIQIPIRPPTRLREYLYTVEIETPDHPYRMSLTPKFRLIIADWYIDYIRSRSVGLSTEENMNRYFNRLLGTDSNLLNLNNSEYQESCDCPRCNSTRHYQKKVQPFLEKETLELHDFETILRYIIHPTPNYPAHLKTIIENLFWKLIRNSNYYENLTLKPVIKETSAIEVEQQIDVGHKSYQPLRSVFDSLPKVLFYYIRHFLKVPDLFRFEKTNHYIHRILTVPYLKERLSTECYYTRTNLEETILGIGIDIEYYRGGSYIKKIHTSLDLVSSIAFQDCHLYQGLDNEKITAVLPLVLHPSHLKRAKKLLITTLNKICRHPELIEGDITYTYMTDSLSTNHYNSTTMIRDKQQQAKQEKQLNRSSSNYKKELYRFQPFFALEILTQLLNTCVTKVHHDNPYLSTKAIQGYCYFHRLLLQFIVWYPAIMETINLKIKNFITQPRKRTKTQIPQLNILLSYIALSTKYNWDDLKATFLKEQQLRAVTNILQASPKWSFPVGELESFREERLLDSFRATHEEKRQTALNIYFITYIAKRTASNQLTMVDYDAYYGKPPRGHSFSKQLREISAKIVDWKSYYQYSNLNNPGHSSLSNQLRLDVLHSLTLKYHSLQELNITLRDRDKKMYGHKGWVQPTMNNPSKSSDLLKWR